MVLNGGLGNLSYDARHLKETEAMVALNVDLSSLEGALKALKTNKIISSDFAGAVKVQGIHRILGYNLISAGGNLYYNVLTTAIRSFSADNRMDAVNYQGRAYICNGDEFLQYDGSTFSTPFITAPSLQGVTGQIVTILTGSITVFADAGSGLVTVTSAAHGLSSGEKITISGTTSYNGSFNVSNITTNTFDIAVTWVADDATGAWEQSFNLPAADYKYVGTWRETGSQEGINREESPPSSEINLTVTKANGKMVISNLPTRTGYNLVLWRWQIGRGSLYNELVEITDGSTSYTDNLLYEELGLDLPSVGYEAPPIPRHLEIFNHNLFISGIKSWQSESQEKLDNYLFWSDDRRFTAWRPSFMAVIGQTDDKLVNKKVIGNVLACYTQKNIYLISGTNARNYRQSKSSAFTGLGAEWALVDTVRYGHLFLGSDRLLHIFNGVNISDPESLRKVDKILERDSDYIYAINWNYRDLCELEFYNNTAFLSYPSGDSTENDKTLIMEFKFWPDIRFTMANYGASVIFPDAIDNVLYAGNDTGELLEIGQGETYFPVTWRSGDFDGGNIHAEKAMEKLVMDYDSKGQDIAVKLYVDDVLNNTITANKNGRAVKESVAKSFASPGSGKRHSVEFSWNAPDNDVVIYDYMVKAQVIKS